jgi:uncharacterized coiled-coil DUF342 family protein
MAGAGTINLDALEDKINKAAERIAVLKEEKLALEGINKELKEKIDSLYIKNEDLTKQIESLKREKGKATEFEKTREEINGKVEEMLAKLEQLDI